MSGIDTTGLVGVAGTGVAHGITPSVSAFIGQAVGTGQAGSMSVLDTSGLVGVQGIGVAGTLQSSIQAFFQGAAGIGIAGQMLANPEGNFAGVQGIGVAGIITIVVSGGGGNGASTGDGDRPKRKRRTGLEPIAKVQPAKPPAPKPTLLPPDWLRRSPSIAPDALPIDETYPEIAQAMPGIARQIMDAHDISDVMHRLNEQDYDEQDMADIADVLALLD